MTEEEEPHLSETSARAGTTPHVGRVVLTASLLLIITIFAVLYFFWSE